MAFGLISGHAGLIFEGTDSKLAGVGWKSGLFDLKLGLVGSIFEFAGSIFGLSGWKFEPTDWRPVLSGLKSEVIDC